MFDYCFEFDVLNTIFFFLVWKSGKQKELLEGTGLLDLSEIAYVNTE